MDDGQLRRVFQRVFRREFSGSNAAVADVPGWDSLTHIKLVMELEREFGISIEPDEIPPLYSDFETVRRFVERKRP